MPTLLRELKMFYKTGKRKLPWRRTRDPYKILVSEIMLQQTQVERVVPYYKAFLKAFPDARALSRAPLSSVLGVWSGLGYNRRAQYLHRSAKQLAAEMPKKGEMNGSSTPFFGISAAELQNLPGVGPYTAAAVRAFAFNEPTVFVETNIRTVFLYHLFSSRTVLEEKVSDKELLPLVEAALRKSKMEPRDFYAALMDYGSYLKRQGVRVNSKSKHYAKQSKFEGSARQKRAARLRKLLARGASERELEKALQ